MDVEIDENGFQVIKLTKTQYDEFLKLLDRTARELPGLKKLLQNDNEPWTDRT